MSSDVLRAVVASARRSANERARAQAPGALDAAVTARRPRGQAFRESLGQADVRIIAECKRRSPSRGVLRGDYDAVAIARAYQAAGAAAISVLTEPTFFDGSLDDLRAVRDGVTLPLLCKDFIVTPFQVCEARAAGADAVLLIVAALDDGMLAELIGLAGSLELAALVEVHDREELRRAEGAGATLIGVNSRNLRTLDVSRSVLDELAPAIPRGVTAVAESGIRSRGDIDRLRALRYDAFLVGEHLVTQQNPGAALAALRFGSEEH